MDAGKNKVFASNNTGWKPVPPFLNRILTAQAVNCLAPRPLRRRAFTQSPRFDYRTATMLTVLPESAVARALPRPAAPAIPTWVQSKLDTSRSKNGRSDVPRTSSQQDVALRVTKSDDLALLTAEVRGAASLEPLALQHRTADLYRMIHRTLMEYGSWHPVRIWNFIPDVRAVTSDGIDRYMVFNAGRFSAYHDWYRQGAAFESSIATATGVGYAGTDLVVHVLAAKHPGTPVENPRQIRSYRYSQRYGPMPPCFARATITCPGSAGLPDLLVGGTASVCGEDSVHLGDVAAQTTETLENLAHLIAAAGRVRRGVKDEPAKLDTRAELRRFESVRIYHHDPESLDAILRIVWPRIDHLDPANVELVLADVCRPELLVEIEGTASLA